MRAIQRINHNAAICEDGAGRQLIALGRGIGFGDMPHEVDLDVVTRTFTVSIPSTWRLSTRSIPRCWSFPLSWQISQPGSSRTN